MWPVQTGLQRILCPPSNCCPLFCGLDHAQAILQEYKHHNCEVIVKEDATIDQVTVPTAHLLTHPF